MEEIRFIKPKVQLQNPDNKFDLSEFVQSVRITKSVSRPVNSMSIVLNPAVEGNLSTTITHNKVVNHLLKQIGLNSIISAKIDQSAKKHTFLGFVDHVVPTYSVNNNSTQRTITVNVSELLGKALTRDNIINAPQLANNPTIREVLGDDRVQWFDWMRGYVGGTTHNVFAKGTPEEVIKFILEKTALMNVDIGEKDKVSIKSYINPKLLDVDGLPMLRLDFLGGESIYDKGLTTFAGPILQYIQQAIDLAWYELFFDTTTGKNGLPYASMIVRPKPFCYKNYQSPVQSNVLSGWKYFEDLPAVEINQEDKILDTCGQSDYELKNTFRVNFAQSLVASANTRLSKFGLSYPITNLESVKKFGMRELTVTSNMINFAGIATNWNNAVENKEIPNFNKLTNSELQFILEKREKIVEFHGFPYFNSGQMRLVGNENIRHGSKLIDKDGYYYDVENKTSIKGIEYYVDTIAHNYHAGSFFTTDVSLQRGAPRNFVGDWFNKNRTNFIGIDSVATGEKEISSNNEQKIAELDKIDEVIENMKNFKILS
ncbi:MAG: hypothetical protein HYS24_03525 [Ignavibacteriales bacterium]|nr:hypothetical protein [Ignavibacteriales bacterium]